jgi:hypothetical protein
VEAVRSAVAGAAVQAELLDLKGEADRLYAAYLWDAVRSPVAGSSPSWHCLPSPCARRHAC